MTNGSQSVYRGVVAEKQSDDLFTLDTTGSPAIKQNYNKVHKPLKADEILAQRSAIDAVDTRKRPGVTDGIIEPGPKRRKSGGLSHKDYERLKNRAYGGESVTKDVVVSDQTPGYDPWTDVIKIQDPRFSYLESPKSIRAPRTLKEAPISLHQGQKAVSAVAKPKPGTSYNPTFEDWDQLLTEEGQREVESERKRILEAEQERIRLERIQSAQNERDEIQTEDDSAWEGFESEYETEEWLAKKRPERKTPAERNKVKKRKETERKAKWDMQLKKRDEQAKQIKAIAKQIEARAKARASVVKTDQAESSDDEVDERLLRRRKFGKSEYVKLFSEQSSHLLIAKLRLPQQRLELVLPDELQDSLRLLKPEGNLLNDRFRNIMIRGMIETRQPIQQPKKARRTYTEKWTYKDFEVPSI